MAGIRLLPLDDPEIPETNPLVKVDNTITSYAVVRGTGTNDVLMAARARELDAAAHPPTLPAGAPSFILTSC